MSEVKQTKGSSIDDDDESDDEDEDEPAKLSVQGIKHKGSVNRVKVGLVGPCPVVLLPSGGGTQPPP